MQVAAVIFLGKNIRLAILVALHDVYGDSINVEAGAARHGRIFSAILNRPN